MYSYRVSLFYSYCHKDESYRERMEVALAQLRDDGLHVEWNDRKIIPGTPFTPQIMEELETADLVVFLVSQDFLASAACKEEWRRVRENAKETGCRLVPIILRPCAWKDFDDMKAYLALPTDGQPISQWADEDEAWLDVYQKIKSVTEDIRNTFLIKEEYRRQISEVEFVLKSENGTNIDELFVFPHLVFDGNLDRELSEKRVASFDELENHKFALIRGDFLSGKTTLCRMLFHHLINKGRPAILIDLEEVGSRRPSHGYLQEMYFKQMKGDYNLWVQRANKIIILDNLSVRTIKFLEFAKLHFQHIFVTTSDDNYLAYFADDRRVSEFKQIRLQPLTHSMQEELIRNWKSLDPGVKSGQIEVYDGRVSQMEREVNSILINRIVPRFPFFVLSILQTFEANGPHDLSITAYGHCYQALIVAHLSKSGIERDDIDSCFNFLGELAYAMCQSSGDHNVIGAQDFEVFSKQYDKKYIKLNNATRNRLFGQPTSILSQKGDRIFFSWRYSYYYFLGLHLSFNYDETRDLIAGMVDKSYLKDNSLTLIFLIHHSNNSELIEDLLLHTMCTIDGRTPVKLDNEEIGAFEGILQRLPDIGTDKSVGETRREERNRRDELEAEELEDVEESPHDLVNDVYKALKNMEILSQIIKNKSRSIERERIYEIIETVTDTALRLASVFLLDSDEIDELAKICKKRLDEEKKGNPPSEEAIKEELGFLVFVLVMSSIEKAVSSIDRKEIREVVEDLCRQRDTPAYDLIQSFYLIDIADRFSESQVTMIKRVLKKHRRNNLVVRALPLRVQMYLNSHRVSGSIRDSLLSSFRSKRGNRSRQIARSR